MTYLRCWHWPYQRKQSSLAGHIASGDGEGQGHISSWLVKKTLGIRDCINIHAYMSDAVLSASESERKNTFV